MNIFNKLNIFYRIFLKKCYVKFKIIIYIFYCDLIYTSEI